MCMVKTVNDFTGLKKCIFLIFLILTTFKDHDFLNLSLLFEIPS